MTRFLLAVSVWSYVITSIALSADAPENPTSAHPAPANAAPVYVKIIWPDDPAGVVGSDRSIVIGRGQPVVETWIVEGVDEKWCQAKFRALTGWVPLVDKPFEVTDLWNGPLDEMVCPYSFHADICERKDGWIKIHIHGGTPPAGGLITVTLKDEPGSREVAPGPPHVRTERGMPHVAIFIGLPVQ